MDYLPIFLRVDEQPVLVVGGGEVALRKVEWFLKAGARVTVVAPQLHEELACYQRNGDLTHLAGPFLPGQLAGVIAAVAATVKPWLQRSGSSAFWTSRTSRASISTMPPHLPGKASLASRAWVRGSASLRR